MCNLIDTNVERGQAECTAMTTRTTATTPTPSDPQRTTFVIHLDYVLGAWSRCSTDASPRSLSVGDASDGPDPGHGPYRRSAQPRARRHRTKPIAHLPAGRPPAPPWSTAHAMAENSEKKAESAETYKMAGVQLAGAQPESRGTSPGDPPRARYGRRTVPTR